jgi:LysM repeat protein
VFKAQRVFAVGCSLLAVLLTAGCNVRGDSDKPTVTPDDVFVIVTRTPGTPPKPTPTPEIVNEYVVQAGDSLLGIALQFGVTLDELQEANDISDPNSIFVGQVLKIPVPDE